MSEPELQSACSFCEDLGSRGRGEQECDRAISPASLPTARAGPNSGIRMWVQRLLSQLSGGPWHRPYLGVGWHHKLGGQADVGHPAFRGEGHRIGQGVLHLDGGGRALPDRAHHLDGFEDAWRGHPETHHVV